MPPAVAFLWFGNAGAWSGAFRYFEDGFGRALARGDLEYLLGRDQE